MHREGWSGPTSMDLRDLISAEASEFTERLAAALTAEVEDSTRRAQEEAEAALNKIRAELQQARAALDKARAESEQATARLCAATRTWKA